MGIGVRQLFRLRRTPEPPPVAVTGRPRTLLTEDGLETLRTQLASDATFRQRWQTAIDQFESDGGTWTTTSTKAVTPDQSPDPGAFVIAAFFTGVRTPTDNLGLTWRYTWSTYKDRLVTAALGWIGLNEVGGWKCAAVALIYDMLYANLSVSERAAMSPFVSASATNQSYCLGNWDDQSASDHIAKVICSLASDNVSTRIADILANTQLWAESREFIAYQSLGYEWKGAYGTNWGQALTLWMIKNYGGYTDAQTTDKHHYHLTHAWMLLRDFVIPHPGMEFPYGARTNMVEPQARYYTASAMNVAANMLWGRALLPGRLNLTLTSDQRVPSYASHPLSDKASIVADEATYWSYWRNYWNYNGNRFSTAINYKFTSQLSPTNSEANIHAIGTLIPWLVMNVQLPATAITATQAAIPLVRRWWPGTLDLTTIRSGYTIANSSESLISYTHQRYYINGYEGNVADNGSFQVHRAGSLLNHRGAASHGPQSRKWAEAANGTISLINPNLYPQFYRVNTDDHDGGSPRSAVGGETKTQVLADPKNEMGQVTAWSADAYAVAISSDLTRSYNCTEVVKDARPGNAAKLDSFKREWVCVRRNADGTDHEHVVTYDRITQTEAQTVFQPRYNLCPATNPDIDGTETARTPWAPDGLPPGDSTAGLLQWTAVGPTWWDYEGATRLIYDNTVEPTGGAHTAQGNGKVCVTWLEPAAPQVAKMGGTNVRSIPSSAADGGPGIGHFNQWAELDGDWDDNSGLELRAYVGLYTVFVAPETVTTDTRFLMAFDVMAATDTPVMATAVTCDATSKAVRVGDSVVVFGKDGARSTGSVEIPDGTGLVVITQLPGNTVVSLSTSFGLNISSANRTTTSGGMLTILVGGHGTLTFGQQPSSGVSLTHLMGIGAVTPSSARYRARTESTATMQIEYSTSSDLSGSTLSAGTQTASEDDFTGGEVISGLSTATQYYYSIVVDGVRQHDAPYPKFKTFPAEGVPTTSKVIFGSCQLSPNGPVFEAIGNENPDLFLHLGDLIYADTNDLARLRSEFYQVQFAPGASDFLDNVVHKTPWDFIWDDHDFGNGSAENGDVPGKANNLKAYKEYGLFYDLANPTQGTWHSFKMGDAEFFMTDTRYQREGQKVRFPSSLTSGSNGTAFIEPDTGSAGTSLVIPANVNPNPFDNWYNSYYCKFADGTVNRVLDYVAATRTLVLDGNIGVGTFHLRKASFIDMDMIVDDQLDWLIDGLNNSTCTWKFLVSSVIWNLTEPESDIWAGFDADHMEQLYIIQRVTADNIIVLSGDRHWSGIDDGTNSHWPEATSSPLDHSNNQTSGTWSHGQYLNGNSPTNYMVVDITPTQVTLTCKDSTGTIVAPKPVKPGVTQVTLTITAV